MNLQVALGSYFQFPLTVIYTSNPQLYFNHFSIYARVCARIVRAKPGRRDPAAGRLPGVPPARRLLSGYSLPAASPAQHGRRRLPSKFLQS